MHQVLQKIFAVGLSFLVLFSTLSFSVDMHFCGHTLVDVEVFQKAKGCGMDMEDGSMTAMGCCRDHQVVVQGQDDLKLPPAIDFSPIQILILPIQPLFLEVAVLNFGTQSLLPEKYIPPLLFRDLSIAHQVFLI
jgi:hypothetical protein